MTSKRRQKAARRRNKPTGSPITGEPVFLVVGKLQRAHGLRGEILMGIQTDFPERLKTDSTVFIGDEKIARNFKSIRQHNKGLLVSFDDYDTREKASELRNQLVFVRVDDRPELPEGEYYHHQLIGLRVITDEGQTLGILSEILETGANDVYVVREEGSKGVLLPAIEDVILNVDLTGKEMLVHLIPGLFPDNK